jgi:prefoldin subunit 5
MALTDEDKQWIAARIGEVRAEIGEVRTEIGEVRAEIEKTETKLLTAFHQWASPVDMRQRSHAAAIRAIDAEMEALDERVKNLEAGRQ